ncbi:hypothetical protein C0993_004956 [Termitomyces sp. T159_Od127]|nr:hypothetical protein C0993_004956 [Termitomyces sp. T159_Od127]
MASLAYISVPPCATRLESPSQSLQRAKKVTTPLPNGTSQLSAPSTNTPTQTGMNSSTAAAFSLLPQMLLSSTLPTTPSSPSAKDKEKEKEKVTRKGLQLLTTKEPLSIPITTANFKRFVAKVGPIFWMQDRIEEVILWKRGWRVTGVWMAAYAFFCYFPKMVFAIPHLALIGIMLASYPYTKPKPGETFPTDSVNWQGNLQGIQNLMGFVADAHDLVQPHAHLLVLTPSHLPSPTYADAPVPPSTSSYPPLILLTLLLTFPPLVVLLASPLFPTRFVCLVGGLLPLVATHPRVFPILPTLAKLAVSLTHNVLCVLVRRYAELYRNVFALWARIKTRGKGDPLIHTQEIDVDLPPLRTVFERIRDNDRLDDTCWNAEMREVELFENERFVASRSKATNNPVHPPSHPSDRPTSPTLVSSFSGVPPPVITSQGHRFPLPSTPLFGATSTGPDPADPGWSKANLRNGERRGWTRGQDGWGGVRTRSRTGSGESQGKGKTGDGGEKAEERDGVDLDTGEGVVRSECLFFLPEVFQHELTWVCLNLYLVFGRSSNLTFSLTAGWTFVGTEGWRRDLARKWVGEGVGVGKHRFSVLYG